jgi:hypothetical protein
MSMGLFRKRTYTVAHLLRDVSYLLPKAPDLLAIWRGRLDPVVREQVMVAVAEVNRCRYCAFVHTEWQRQVERTQAGSAGEPPALGTEAEQAQLATEFGAARAAVEFEGSVALDPRFDGLGERERDDVETVARAMTVANRVGNTVDALLARLRGDPVEGSRLANELAIALLFAGAAPWVAALLAYWRRQDPLSLLRDFRRFSAAFESKPVAGGDDRLGQPHRREAARS